MALLPPSPREFLRAFGKNWVLAMAGAVGVAAWLIAAFFPHIGASKIVEFAALSAVMVATYGIWARERQQVVDCEERVQDGPDIQIAPAGFYEDARDLDLTLQEVVYELGKVVPTHMNLRVSMLHVRIINQPHGIPSERSSAKGVIGRLHFIDSSDKELFFIDGRWSDTTQPSNLQPNQSTVDLLSIDIPVGQIRELDIACKLANSDAAYAFNNDSYSHSGLANPNWRLPQGEYKVRVHVMGSLVNVEWLLPFQVGGWGEPLKVESGAHYDP